MVTNNSEIGSREGSIPSLASKKNKNMESKGLGDTIAKITEATGIDKVVEAVVGEDCGCKERRAKLNNLFPYKENTKFINNNGNFK